MLQLRIVIVRDPTETIVAVLALILVSGAQQGRLDRVHVSNHGTRSMIILLLSTV